VGLTTNTVVWLLMSVSWFMAVISCLLLRNRFQNDSE